MSYQNINEYNFSKIGFRPINEVVDISLVSDELNYDEETVFSNDLIAENDGNRMPFNFDLNNSGIELNVLGISFVNDVVVFVKLDTSFPILPMELITLVIFFITSLIIFVKLAISNASAANRFASAAAFSAAFFASFAAASAAFFAWFAASDATLLTLFVAFLKVFLKLKFSIFLFLFLKK